MPGFTDEERRAERARRDADEEQRTTRRRLAEAYRPTATDPVCVICNLQFPAHQNSSPDTPVCDSCF